MGLAITDEHVELTYVTDRFLSHHDAVGAARAALDADTEELPPFWAKIGETGWLGVHLPERFGGDGFGLAEAAIVVEQFRQALGARSLLPTVMTSAALAALGSDEQVAPWLEALASGTTVGAVGQLGDLVLALAGSLDGSAGPVLGGAVADLLLLRVGQDIAVVSASADVVKITRQRGLDPSRRPVLIECVSVGPELHIRGASAQATAVVRLLAAADATGIAAACTEMATRYAGERTQFERPIGMFQAVKHHCADMFVDTELAVATTWGAAREGGGEGVVLGAAAAYSTAIRAAITASEHNIQIHGGIGFTWDHGAHLHLRRALTLRACFGSPDNADAHLAELTAAGQRRQYGVSNFPPRRNGSAPMPARWRSASRPWTRTPSARSWCPPGT